MHWYVTLKLVLQILFSPIGLKSQGMQTGQKKTLNEEKNYWKRLLHWFLMPTQMTPKFVCVCSAGDLLGTYTGQDETKKKENILKKKLGHIDSKHPKWVKNCFSPIAIEISR